MVRRRRYSAALCAGLLALASCSGGQPIDGTFAAVVVYGQVTGPGGSPVAGAIVQLDALEPACQTDLLLTLRDTTDAGGGYRLQPGNWGTEFTICLRVQASPPAGAGLAPDSATRSPVRMRSDALDSVRVDLHLPSTP
jgi:hypothetical protein